MRVNTTKYFDKWYSKIKDRPTLYAIRNRLNRIMLEDNLGEYRDIGDSVFEIKMQFKDIRIYFSFGEHNELIVLLLGGNKSSQQQDIEKAKSIKRGLDNGKVF